MPRSVTWPYRGHMHAAGVPQRPPFVDLLVATLFTGVVVVEAFTEPSVSSPVGHALVAAPAMLAMAWRRRWPLVCTGMVVAAWVGLAWSGGELSLVLATAVMAFTVGSETAGRRSWLGLALLVIPSMTASVVQYTSFYAGDFAAMGVLIVAPWMAGRAMRERAVRLAAAIARADRLELEKSLEADAAAARERTRLARELHDVVSHSISVIAIQTQAVRRRLGPGAEREIADLRGVETAAREAMQEMRRLLGVLRVDGEVASLAPQPGLRELPRLVQQLRASGVSVDVVTGGDPVDLPPGLDLAAYRILQEGVTNALRHSGGTRIIVRVEYAQTEVVLGIEDNGRGMEGTPPRTGRHGLTGIRERAEMYGGHLEISSVGGGGTRLRARLPVGGLS